MDRRLAFVLVCAVLTVAVWFGMNAGSPAADEAPPVQKWEYTLRERIDAMRMNKLGAEGWEMCGAYGLFVATDVPATERYIFKRPIR